jgi:hypothetical protein
MLTEAAAGRSGGAHTEGLNTSGPSSAVPMGGMVACTAAPPRNPKAEGTLRVWQSSVAPLKDEKAWWLHPQGGGPFTTAAHTFTRKQKQC